MIIQNFSMTPIIVLIIQGLLAWALWSVRQAFVREEDYAEHVEQVQQIQQEYNSRLSKHEGVLLGLEERINMLPDVTTIAHLVANIESLRGDIKAINTRITGLDRLIERVERATERATDRVNDRDRQESILRANQSST